MSIAATACTNETKSLSVPTTAPTSVTTTLVTATTAGEPTTTSTTAMVEPSTTIAAATTVVASTTTVTTVVPTTVAQSVPEQTAPETTAVPVTTAAPETTAPAGTVAPPTTGTTPPTGCNACRPEYTFAWPSYFEVPQLGTEPVRGTGCGADGSLGTSIPDGVWNGFITLPKSGSTTTLSFDVQCIYYGESAAPYVAQCELTDTEESCLEYGDEFWMVNNNERTRSVELDPGFRRRYASVNCTDPGPGKGAAPQNDGQDDFDSWLIIENGRATFALTSCVYG